MASHHRPTKVTGVTATLAQVKDGKAGDVVLVPGSIVTVNARVVSVEENEMGGMD